MWDLWNCVLMWMTEHAVYFVCSTLWEEEEICSSCCLMHSRVSSRLGWSDGAHKYIYLLIAPQFFIFIEFISCPVVSFIPHWFILCILWWILLCLAIELATFLFRLWNFLIRILIQVIVIGFYANAPFVVFFFLKSFRSYFYVRLIKFEKEWNAYCIICDSSPNHLFFCSKNALGNDIGILVEKCSSQSCHNCGLAHLASCVPIIDALKCGHLPFLELYFLIIVNLRLHKSQTALLMFYWFLSR